MCVGAAMAHNCSFKVQFLTFNLFYESSWYLNKSTNWNIIFYSGKQTLNWIWLHIMGMGLMDTLAKFCIMKKVRERAKDSDNDSEK